MSAAVGTRIRLRVGLAMLGAIACVVALLGVQPVEAAWTDREAGTATVAADTVVAPVGTQCVRQGQQGNQVAFLWSQPSGGPDRTGYSVSINRQGSSAVIAQSSAYPAGSRSVTITANTSQLQRGTIYEVHVQAVADDWSSERTTALFLTDSNRADRIVACGWR